MWVRVACELRCDVCYSPPETTVACNLNKHIACCPSFREYWKWTGHGNDPRHRHRHPSLLARRRPFRIWWRRWWWRVVILCRLSSTTQKVGHSPNAFPLCENLSIGACVPLPLHTYSTRPEDRIRRTFHILLNERQMNTSKAASILYSNDVCIIDSVRSFDSIPKNRMCSTRLADLNCVYFRFIIIIFITRNTIHGLLHSILCLKCASVRLLSVNLW